MYKLELTKEAKKELKIIRDVYGEDNLAAALSEIKEFPFIGKPLKDELMGQYTYRVGVYRIVYKVNIKDKMITIMIAGHRANVYEK